MIDSDKLSAWFEAHAAPLVLYARQVTADERAPDAVQEAFVRLMQEIREPTNVKAWLYRAVRNAAVSAARSDDARARRHAAIGRVRPAWFDPRADDVIDAAAAQAHLATLPMRIRVVVVLRVWGDMSFPEIAAVTGLPVSTAFDHYRKGLAAIRQQMESSCHATNRSS